MSTLAQLVEMIKITPKSLDLYNQSDIAASVFLSGEEPEIQIVCKLLSLLDW